MGGPTQRGWGGSTVKRKGILVLRIGLTSAHGVYTSAGIVVVGHPTTGDCWTGLGHK